MGRLYPAKNAAPQILPNNQKTERKSPGLSLCFCFFYSFARKNAQISSHTSFWKKWRSAWSASSYQNEQAAQSAVAVIDAALEDVRASGGGLDEALAAVDEALPADAQRDGSRVLMTFASSSGRTLDVELTITANATYEISQWKATTQWTNDGPGATLWSGAAQTR